MNNILNLITCPITLDIFNEPVILSDGFTYEKEVIKLILKKEKISPITGKILNDNLDNLTTNYLIKNLIDEVIKLILKNKNISPITRKILNDEFDNVTTNYIIKNLIDEAILTNLINDEQIYKKYTKLNENFNINSDFFEKEGKNNILIKIKNYHLLMFYIIILIIGVGVSLHHTLIF